MDHRGPQSQFATIPACNHSHRRPHHEDMLAPCSKKDLVGSHLCTPPPPPRMRNLWREGALRRVRAAGRPRGVPRGRTPRMARGRCGASRRIGWTRCGASRRKTSRRTATNHPLLQPAGAGLIYFTDFVGVLCALVPQANSISRCATSAVCLRNQELVLPSAMGTGHSVGPCLVRLRAFCLTD
jgi:hypothetical protein